MKVLTQEITGFVSTNLAQPLAEWVDTTAYSAGQEVVYKNHIYRSIVNDNTGVIPSLNTGKWLLFGVDNSYASIDLHSLTASVIDDGLTYIEFEFASIGFDTLAFKGLVGLSLDIYEYNSIGTQIALTNKSTVPTETPPAIQTVDLVFDTILAETEKIKIRLHKTAGGEASIDSMVGGKAFDIGATSFGVTGGFVDFSVRKTDDYGITTITKRNVQETFKGDLMIDATRTQTVKRYVRYNCMGTTIMFIADESVDSKYENLLMLGYIADFDIRIDNGVKSFGTIEIEESL